MPLKKSAAIFLLVVLVFVQTPMGQIFKLPVLLEHYSKHQRSERLSFAHFLEEHYASHHDDADLPEDEQLPFKNFTLHSMASAIVTNVFQSASPPILTIEEKAMFARIYIPQQMLSSIFHPPKA